VKQHFIHLYLKIATFPQCWATGVFFFLQKMSPALENTLSQGTDEAGMDIKESTSVNTFGKTYLHPSQ